MLDKTQEYIYAERVCKSIKNRRYIVSILHGISLLIVVNALLYAINFYYLNGYLSKLPSDQFMQQVNHPLLWAIILQWTTRILGWLSLIAAGFLAGRRVGQQGWKIGVWVGFIWGTVGHAISAGLVVIVLWFPNVVYPNLPSSHPFITRLQSQYVHATFSVGVLLDIVMATALAAIGGLLSTSWRKLAD